MVKSKVNKTDSTHENYFEWWLKEAVSAGYIDSWTRGDTIGIAPKQTLPFTKHLKTKDVFTKKHLFHPHTYTPDYIIHWKYSNFLHDDMHLLDSKSNAFFLSEIKDGIATSVVDIKPDRIGRNTQHSSITFPINQKLVFELYNLYVQKVVLYPASNSKKTNKTLFETTWCPVKYVKQEVYKMDRKGKWKKGESKIKWPLTIIG